MSAAPGPARTAPWSLDVPYTLALAFWAAALEVVFHRGLGAFASHFSPRGHLAAILGPVLGVGLFMQYFSTLLCTALAVYVIVSLLGRPGFLAWWRKISIGLFGLVATSSVLFMLVYPSIIGGTNPDHVVGLIVMAHGSITALATLLSFSVLGLRTGIWKKIFATLPAVLIIITGIHQFFYFYPLSMPGWMSGATPDVVLVAGQFLALLFPFPVAVYIAYQHMKHGLPVFIHVLVAISGFFPCLVLANMPSAVYRDAFFSMLGMPIALPAPGILYPLVMLPLLFVFSALVGTPVASRAFMISRRRAGFALGLVYLGSVTPLSAAQAAFLLLGIVLWMKSIVLD